MSSAKGSAATSSLLVATLRSGEQSKGWTIKSVSQRIRLPRQVSPILVMSSPEYAYIDRLGSLMGRLIYPCSATCH